MSRGITENDVWTACDALLLAGERPTIERVRLKLGRGSPNTVSPMLDTWFKNLGGRIKDPGAFAAPLDVPDPVIQAAQHFWAVAQAESRADFDVRLQAGLASLQATVEQHRSQALAAENAASQSRLALAQCESELSELKNLFQAERAAHAASLARLDEARHQADEWRQRHSEVQRSLNQAHDQARADVQAAQERATGAERRAALEIEHERQQRSKADKRSEQLERKLDQSLQELVSERKLLANTQTDLQAAQQQQQLQNAQHAQALYEAEQQLERLQSTLDALTATPAPAAVAPATVKSHGPRSIHLAVRALKGAASLPQRKRLKRARR